MVRTDLAYEITRKIPAADGITIEKSTLFSLPLTKISVKEPGSEKIGKPAGEYVTLFCADSGKKSEEAQTEALTKLLSDFIKPEGKVLVVGLGNENITPDSLGTRTVSKVAATAHFSGESAFRELGMREVFAVETGVLAQTGIESAEQIRYISGGIKPQLIIAVDSLACSELPRLGKTVQIVDSGIAPGSGVKNARKEMSEKTLGVPVLAIGVPTVIDLESLIDGKELKKAGAMVVPRDIDIIVNHFARVISGALNRALNPKLSPEEIDEICFSNL